MLKMMLVSIVTPSFNQQRFLEATIRSVLEQDYPRIEYMVVDGGSTDGSIEIIRRYADRLAWWVSEPDKGQAEAINKGLSHARGEIAAWLNSDDLYLPGAIARAVEAFESHPQAGVIFGDMLAIDENGKPINLQRFGNWGLEDLMAFRILGQPSMFMRRSVLEQAGYLDTSFHFLLDHHLWIRMARIADIHYIPVTLSAARFHAAAKNEAGAAEFGREAFRIVEWMQAQPNLASLLARHKRQIWAGVQRLDAYYLVEGGQYATGLAAYARSLRVHPPTVLRDWKRVTFAVLSLLGFRRVRGLYTRLRQASLRSRSPR